ncbi:MAG: hypothetical protein A2381_08780 [Bdellovibrionales bacterium RIFOXYB1_FULL_37_110]|nr:MAG: hypothetical protein A2181_08975 [Bdellovibrionales bacterium RIFOXYA1_FULL_38_20]OFZ51209.1 MAG: hypothetical protein A2417_17380 [Bdellovibrionales bacterium RIFOXYC1_FULL_37_79]OFZ60935.1 MAG: hypothetical protein A2381_08780 [Bdellovibrionales bacterium RIFOXYB1_FULL_37_110]OFZ63679.1 MAG: hypothetical protein A2577_07900 [Bdellovibrionales bacterium RIFOXYD1_FULL_36_51]
MKLWSKALKDGTKELTIHGFLSIFKTAYKEFEGRVGEIQTPKGSKTGLIITALEKQLGKFSVADLQKACPATSTYMIRKVLKNLKKEGKVECLGRGKDAFWKKI